MIYVGKEVCEKIKVRFKPQNGHSSMKHILGFSELLLGLHYE